MSTLSFEQFENFFKFYRQEEHQKEGLERLYEQLPLGLIDDTNQWVVSYRTPQVPTVKTGLLQKWQLAEIWECSERLIEDHEIVEMNACLEKFQINTRLRMAHFLSQTAHESGGGKWKVELSDGRYLRGRSDLGHGPYEGELWKGAGYIQLTGKYNYKRFSQYMQDPKIVLEGCEYVAKHYPFTSAGFWWHDNNLNSLCDTDPSVEAVTRRVNGGYNGLADRKHYFRNCLRVLS